MTAYAFAPNEPSAKGVSLFIIIPQSEIFSERHGTDATVVQRFFRKQTHLPASDLCPCSPVGGAGHEDTSGLRMPLAGQNFDQFRLSISGNPCNAHNFAGANMEIQVPYGGQPFVVVGRQLANLKPRAGRPALSPTQRRGDLLASDHHLDQAGR
jgi:hypothetical protein